MTDEPITRIYGHGSITLTHYPSSRRVAVVQTGTNAVMDTSDLYRFMEDTGLLNKIRAEAWDEGFDAGEADVYMHDTTPEGYDVDCIENPYRPNEK